MSSVAAGEPRAGGPAAPVRTVPDLLVGPAREQPRSEAVVVHGGGSLTYGDWARHSNRVARGLVRRGVRPGDRVALLFDNDHWDEYATCYMGVLKAGATAVPLAPRFAATELAAILEHCGAAGVVCPPELAPDRVPAGVWTAPRTEVADGEDPDPYQADVAGADLAEILYTSGTTGRAKGVACTHDNLLLHDLPAESSAGAPTAVRFLHAFPVGTNAGQEVLRQTLRRPGTTAVVLARFDPELLAEAVVDHGVTRLQLVPAMARMVLDAGIADRYDLSGVRRVVLSSAPLPPAIVERLGAVFPNATVCNAYALTEAGTARTLLVGAGSRPGSVGRPVGGTEVRVAGEDGEPLQAGHTGEIWLRRPGAPRREYYRDAEATRDLFRGDWLRTGDLGYLDGDGYLFLVDRRKDVIIRGGANVASVEVENVLYEHPAVVEAAVFGIPHDVLGQDVAAAVVLRSPATARELQAFVRERLGEHGTPRQVAFLDRLPRNASGKVLKRELVAGSAVRIDQWPGTTVPRRELESVVAGVWEAVLGVDGIGVHDDFFGLGGHSLAATRAAGRLGELLDVEVTPTAVFEHPTVAELAAALEERRAGGDRPD